MCDPPDGAINGAHECNAPPDLSRITGPVINGTPCGDFGGGHPDPDPIRAKPLVDLVMGEDAPDFGWRIWLEGGAHGAGVVRFRRVSGPDQA